MHLGQTICGTLLSLTLLSAGSLLADATLAKQQCATAQSGATLMTTLSQHGETITVCTVSEGSADFGMPVKQFVFLVASASSPNQVLDTYLSNGVFMENTVVAFRKGSQSTAADVLVFKFVPNDKQDKADVELSYLDAQRNLHSIVVTITQADVNA